MKPKLRLTEEQTRAAERKLRQEARTKFLLEFLRKHAEWRRGLNKD